MTVLTTFFESSLKFLSNNLKKPLQLWDSQVKKRCRILKYQKRSLKEQSGTKSSVKPTLSEKITVLNTFLESSLNFLSNHLKKHYNIWYSQAENWCQNCNCQQRSLKGQSGTKSPVKPT